jgi:hypothetical protein
MSCAKSARLMRDGDDDDNEESEAYKVVYKKPGGAY